MMTRLFVVVLTLVAFSGCLPPADDAATTFHTVDAPAPVAGTMFFYPERIPLSEGGFFNAERGMIFVPIDRSKAGSDVIGIEVYRFRASAKASPGSPPIFFLHGGPSFTGLERALEVEGTFEELKGKGVKIDKSPHPSPTTGRRNVLLRDPDGWRLQLTDKVMTAPQKVAK